MKTRQLQNGNLLYLFPDENIDIVRLDFIFDAGVVRQKYFLLANFASKLFSKATKHHSSDEIAEFIDFHGIEMSAHYDVSSATVTVYVLKKYAAEFFPLLQEMFLEPAFDEGDFRIFAAKHKQTIAAEMQKTSYRARLTFEQDLWGKDSLLGRFALPEDVDRIQLQDVKEFYFDHYKLSEVQMILSGNCDETILSLVERFFAAGRPRTNPPSPIVFSNPRLPAARSYVEMDSPQSSLRVGRILPYAWDSVEYVRFLVLNTLLGGYFGSRLMTNIREDKGYTYGIYSSTRLYRGINSFSIAADVAAEHADDSLREIYFELQRLCDEPVSDDELDRVRSYMMGDYLRTMDGVFEQAERFGEMLSIGLDNSFNEHLLQAIKEVTPAQLQQLAREVFHDLTEAVAGPSKA